MGNALGLPKGVVLPDRWSPRPYQQKAWDALTRDGVRRAVLLWHRRAGKDSVLLNATILAAAARPGIYWHIFPTAKQGRKIVWDGLTKEGRPFLNFWPRALVSARSDTDMKLKLANGSVWQVVSADNFNEALIGGNPMGLVFSEYALQSPRCWDYLRPILAENGGWAAFAYTPRGNNHGADLFRMASASPDWFCERLTVDDTGAIDKAAVEAERKQGMPDELIEQEFYCSFTAALVGAYYGKLLAEAERQNRLSSVQYAQKLPVETWWDLGINDSTAIWFVQHAHDEIRVIDYYEANGEGLDHYAAVLRDKGYVYNRHVFPHDISVRDLGSGRSRFETLRRLGVVNPPYITGVISRRLNVADGINAVRTILPKCWFDVENCARGIEALKQYQREWDDTRKIFRDEPRHDWTSHAADAFRTGATSLRVQPGNGVTIERTDYNPLNGPPWRQERSSEVDWPSWWTGRGDNDRPRTIEIHDDPDDRW